MLSLYETLAIRVNEWRAQGYPHAEYPTIAEILKWAADPEAGGFRLRPPQLRALETYWYLRLVEGTPHIRSSSGRPSGQSSRSSRVRRTPLL